MRNRQMKRLMSVLTAENSILRQGTLDALPNLTQQKELLMRDLEQLKVSREDLAELQTAARRNAQLLSAAMAGVKEARARLGELDAVQSGLSIYTALGDKQTVAKQSTGLERKA